VIKRVAVVAVSIPLLMLAPAQAAPLVPTAPLHSARVCPVSTSHDRVGCFAWVRTGVTGRALVSALVPNGYGPTQFHAAYQLPTTSPVNQTIAIVDAYNNPNVFADLKKYNKAFGLPVFPKCNQNHKTSCLSVLNQKGKQTPLPAGNVGWGLEISLDVQVAHAICQNCKIMLVEASSANFSDIEAAVNMAVKKGATVVSNSYGDYANDCVEPGYDHPHVAIVVSSGDSGFRVACPAVLNTVVSVGGTRLTLAGNGTYGSESVWSGSGSGCSLVSAAQSWQSSLVGWAGIGCGTGRGMNDVAADADPATGAAVYDSYGYGGWLVVGGTSLSAPIIAGAYALAGDASTWSYPAQSVYTGPAASFNDVTTGTNGVCAFTLQCHAGSGFDLPTGVGTPKGLGGF
jgi:subtilase family serine protease